jgi:nucleolar protein 15
MSKSLLNMNSQLASLDGPEWDSSDSEASAPTLSNLSKKGFGSSDVVSLSSKKDARRAKDRAKRRTERRAERAGGSPVIYLGHLPRSFEEAELLGFLGQFGPVEGVHLARSKRTGGAKGYAFVKFGEEETARIVADTMSG